MKDYYNIIKNTELNRFDFDSKDNGKSYYIDFDFVHESEDLAWFVLTMELKKLHKNEENIKW